MKFTIMKKMFIVAALPIITLLIYSLNHIDTKYQNLKANEESILKISFMNDVGNLLHELQYERSISIGYMHKDEEENQEDLLRLKQQYLKTNSTLEEIKLHIKKTAGYATSASSKKYMQSISSFFETLESTRNLTIDDSISLKKMTKFYTSLNNQLIYLFESFVLSTNNDVIGLKISALHSIIELQEYTTQENDMITKYVASQVILKKEMRTYRSILNLQNEQKKKISFLLKEQKLASTIENIQLAHVPFTDIRSKISVYEKESLILREIYNILGLNGLFNNLYQYRKTEDEKFFNNFIQKRNVLNSLIIRYMALSTADDQQNKTANELRSVFLPISKQSLTIPDSEYVLKLYYALYDHPIVLDSKKSFNLIGQIMDNIHQEEKNLLRLVLKETDKEKKLNYSSLRNQILTTLFTIAFLIFGTYYISNTIRGSILKLENGMNSFFEFLNFKNENAEVINTNSSDELNDIAQIINKEIASIESSLKQDLKFIDETTSIVTLMKNGDFSQTLYDTPHNPHLKELKDVFNSLVELIVLKIQEQTDSLEVLNSSLEEKVHFQTLELEKQILEITIEKDKAISAEIAKDEFLANMSHEIRTPLNAILGFVKILQKQTSEKDSLNHLSIIASSGESLLAIINDILDFSKIKSGKFIINKQETNIIEEMSNVVLLFASKAYEKHIMYAVYIDPKIPQNINIDNIRVKQILSNLLSNAIKFTPEDGRIKIKITSNGTHLLIMVKDSGIGIAKENQEKVFHAFEQADGSTTRKYGGTGLGLSISHKLASLMDGSLTLNSQEKKGSTFYLQVPIETLDKEAKVLINPSEINNYKINIISPHAKSSEIEYLRYYLQDFGATNIIETRSFQEGDYDLIFFVPEDSYNEDIISSKIPSIALLRTTTIKLAQIDHINPLYSPYTPKTFVEAIHESGIEKVIEKKVEVPEEDEIQFIGKILVVEDNKTNQLLISMILDDYGLDFKMANDGIEGVKTFKKEKFDLVLMDENMPNLNGIGAMEQIKEYEKENELLFTPIIALTASVLDTDKKKFLDVGMDGFVGKPIDTKELESELGRYLKQKS